MNGRAPDRPQWEAVFEHLHLGVYVCRLEVPDDERTLRLIFANPASAAATGVDPERIVGRTLDETFPGLRASGIARRMAEVARTGLPCELGEVCCGDEAVCRTLSGVRAFPLPDQCLAVTFENRTDPRTAETSRWQTEERVRRQNAILAELASGKAFDRTDVQATVRSVTEAAANTLDVERVSVWLCNEDRSAIRCLSLYEREKRTHTGGLELKAADYPSYFRALQEERLIAADDARTDPRTVEFTERYLRPLGITAMMDAPIRCGDRTIGVVCHEHVGGARQWAPDEQNFARSMADLISLVLEGAERKRAEAKIRWQAYHDTLTGLPNRASFYERLALEIDEARTRQEQLAVLFVDLNRFKPINDTLGHEMGDALLCAVAQRFSECLRPDDTIARLGGDEFVILLSRVKSAGEAVKVAGRLLERLREPLLLGGLDLSVSASIGISLFPDHGGDASALLRHADTAMYRAKQERSNGYQLYTEAMTLAVFQRLMLETSLRKAVEREEFALHYQPQVDLRTGEWIGVEALIRWQHPDQGLVLPVQFIPMAEESGLIAPIGEWALRQACRQAARWQEQGWPWRVSVNVSARQFRQGEFDGQVQAVLAETGLRPERLELELTETLLMDVSAEVLATLEVLKQLGVRLAVDDFGSGYSSLFYLRRLPLDVLKVDRSFIQHIAEVTGDRAVVQGVIEIARTLGLAVIAEGVETAAQRECLAPLQWHGIQGFLISPALPPGELEALAGQLDRQRPAVCPA